MTGIEQALARNAPCDSDLLGKWAEYRSSFVRFIDTQQRFQDIAGAHSMGTEVVEKAATELEFARIMHNGFRDDLAAALPGGIIATGTGPGSGGVMDGQIADMAALLDQCRDNPGESAAETLLVAERVVRAALSRAGEAWQ